jgi:hypothetical protein
MVYSRQLSEKSSRSQKDEETLGPGKYLLESTTGGFCLHKADLSKNFLEPAPARIFHTTTASSFQTIHVAMASDGIQIDKADSPSVTEVEESLHERTENLTVEDSSEGSPAPNPHRGARGYRGEIRTEPFKFGTRYLKEDDDPFDYNAWDHVEVDEEYKTHAEAQYEQQRANPVSDFDKSMSSKFCHDIF